MLSDALILFIVLAPGVASLIGLFHKQTGDRAVMAVTTGTVLLCGALAMFQLFAFAFGDHGGEVSGTIVLTNWVDVAGFKADWAVRVDSLSITMMAVITGVSGLVHLYSWGYMATEKHKSRFFAYLSFFTFTMLMLVVADNFLQLFFGWEGVGLASYLLIGFWYKKAAPNAAAIKAFVTNRVGDFGLALGIMAVYFVFGSIEFDVVLEAIRTNAVVEPLGFGDAVQAAPIRSLQLSFIGIEASALDVIGILLFIGAMGKSAQFLLHVWLPDAMEGPTPVSALIHAATMVTAGVYLICLLSPIYEHAAVAAALVTLTGAVTAFYAATVGLAQNDIKRVIAYSTCSQLGYMFFAAGVGLYEAAMFHLFTHAFFKALLFLGAGSVIHGVGGKQDMRSMGGLLRFMPLTYAAMMIGTIAITGLGLPLTDFGFSGFFSKDAVLEGAYVAGVAGLPFAQLAFWFGILAAFLTSLYSWRLIYMTFHGPYTGKHLVTDDGTEDDHDHDHDHAHHGDPHESPAVMLIPLALLSIGAVFAGYVFYDPMFHHHDDFWGAALYHAEGNTRIADVEALKYAAKAGEGGAWVFWLPVIVTLLGLAVATFVYLLNRGMGQRIAASNGPLHSLFYNKWFFDEVYHAVFVRGFAQLGGFFSRGDRKVLDGIGPDGAANAARWSSRTLSGMHTGYLYHYAFVIILTVIAFGAVLIWRNGGLA